MMLVMIAEVKTGDQRHQPAEFIRACVVSVGERLALMAMRPECPEVE
jgi:hypothetical protein